ncbi:sensor histidine kinase [Microaceticoccus formicicus]|uniref:sensor histidine kinase n=1 Tax=Microaceticoccus formicicus TaxID=3118105 RepID=UPI003CD02181|nr:HAMP domain-containing sensor histidine kinase [Peptoniphilaceae bacterium AMB_02]
MKLKNKLLLYMFQGIIIVIIVLGILFNFIFDKNFNSYLFDVRQDRFDQIKSQIGLLLKMSDTDTLIASLSGYAEMEDIEIEILDSNNKSLYKFNPLKEDRELIQKSYEMQEGGKKIGSIVISYYNDGFFDDIAISFKKNIFISLLLAGLVAVFAGMVASSFISRKMSNSILDISKMAMNYKSEKYDHIDVNTDIKELSDLSDNMKYLGDSLNRQEMLRKQYAQDISHELRTPLTNLQLQIEAINDGIIELDENSLSTIKEEIVHLNKLIEQLRMSFDESSKLSKLKIETFSLSEMLENTTKTLTTTANKKGVNLKSDIAEDISITSDPDRLVQIMYNLISNALKASSVESSVIVKLEKLKNNVKISVIDEGIGISEENLKKVFDRFFKADTSRNSQYGGSGLGLAITKKMVETLNGKIYAESELKKGSTFTVELPININIKAGD